MTFRGRNGARGSAGRGMKNNRAVGLKGVTNYQTETQSKSYRDAVSSARRMSPAANSSAKDGAQNATKRRRKRRGEEEKASKITTGIPTMSVASSVESTTSRTDAHVRHARVVVRSMASLVGAQRKGIQQIGTQKRSSRSVRRCANREGMASSNSGVRGSARSSTRKRSRVVEMWS